MAWCAHRAREFSGDCRLCRGNGHLSVAIGSVREGGVDAVGTREDWGEHAGVGAFRRLPRVVLHAEGRKQLRHLLRCVPGVLVCGRRHRYGGLRRNDSAVRSKQRQAPRGGSRNLRRMLLRRADAMLLLSVAQFSPPDLVSVLWPNYSTSDAKLALANLLLWKSEIGDVVMPNLPLTRWAPADRTP